MREYLIGVDVGGTSVKLGKFDLEGNLLYKWSIKTDKTNQGELILKQIAKTIQENVSIQSIKGIGIGVPGPVKNNIVLNCVNLGWGSKDVEKELREVIIDEDIIIKVGNDATIATVGEMFKGVARGYQNVLMFTLGTGVGGGVIANGTLLEGKNGVSGELGHMVVDYKYNFPCNCGKKGCVETLASATGIVNLAKYKLARTKEFTPLRKFRYLSAKKVIDHAKMGDKFSKDVLDESMEYLARAMAFTSLTIDPDIIVIGGGVSNAGEMLIELIEKHYYKLVKPFITHQRIEIATLGNEAGIYGCAYLVK